jgi:hypothetical protein
MHIKHYLLLSLTSLLQPLHLSAQKAMYVYGQGTCQAFDIRNVDSVEVSGGKVEISLAATYDARDVDSISFIAPRGNVVPRGWWGDMQNGQASCYYTDGGDGLPDMLFDIEDSLCTSALYYPSASQPMPSASVRRVGRKWRYVKNTLTRRHKFQLQLNGMPPLSSGPDTDSDGRGYYDIHDAPATIDAHGMTAADDYKSGDQMAFAI